MWNMENETNSIAATMTSLPSNGKINRADERPTKLSRPTPQAAQPGAAECVRDQGGDEAYFEMHDKIFANQQALSIASLKTWAQELGYSIDSCLDSGKFESEVANDLADGQAAGGRGTPYFVINGKPLSGAQPFSAFKQIIDAELA